MPTAKARFANGVLGPLERLGLDPTCKSVRYLVDTD